MVELVDETYKKLKSKHRDIFDLMYQKSSNSAEADSYKYVNHITLDETTIIYESGDEIFHVDEESVFICLAKNREIKKAPIVPFYVSKEYNMRTESNEPSHYIAGRFIFQGNPKELNLFALVEEAAKLHVSPSFNIERYYLFMRKNRPLGK